MKKKKKKLKISFVIITAVLLLYYVFWIYIYNFYTIHMHLIETVILLMPIAILFLYSFKTKRKAWTFGKVTFTIILILIIIGVNFGTLVSVYVFEGTSSESNPNKYKHIYNIAGYKEYTYQFPSELSKDVIDSNKTKFYYSKQFMQSGFNFELLIPMQKENRKDYIAKYEDNIKEKIETTNTDELYNKYGIMLPYKLLESNECNEFFEDCIIYILESKQYKPDDWNHGHVAYIAENEELEEILFVTQVW